ncbi:hypothetical protein COOONC_24529 [Cooperia oncophora]
MRVKEAWLQWHCILAMALSECIFEWIVEALPNGFSGDDIRARLLTDSYASVVRYYKLNCRLDAQTRTRQALS